MTVALLLHRADGTPLSTPFRKTAFGTADPFAREGAVIARGTPLRIMAVSRAVFVSCAALTEEPTNPGITALRADASFKPSTPPPVETLLGATPHCRSDKVFVDVPA